MEFLIKAVDGGKVSSALQKLKPGNYVQLDGAYGKFTIKNIDDTKQPFVFIASGTGIAPFHSFALSYPNLNYSVLHGIRYVNERYDEKDYKKGCYIPCISREKTDKYFSGRVSDYLRKNPPTPTAVYYLCGNTDMINEVYDILRENDVSGDRIFTEVFF
jgi:ferredoxin/flavodoxin---NADP+ reductase